MKLTSINNLIVNAGITLKRFPFVILSSLTSVILMIYLIENDIRLDKSAEFYSLILSSTLGIPLFFLIKTTIERYKIHFKIASLLNLLGIAFLILNYFNLIGSYGEILNSSITTYYIINICIHLAIAFVPYLYKDSIKGFWNYNKTLFLRFLLSLFYSGTLYIGLALAIFAVESLFDLDFYDKIYFELFITTLGLFNTIFFLAGVPSDFKKLNSKEEFPKGLRIFSQYLLMPLQVIYLAILYSYCAKILITGDWPSNLVSTLIIVVSILGVLFYLLAYPFANYQKQKTLKVFSRIYFFLLLPLVPVLFIAVSYRIGEYGLTINRLIIVMLGIWLSIISLYYIFGSKNIKFIPISLSVLFLFFSFGPWGLHSIVKSHHINRIETILIKNDYLEDGKVNTEVSINLDSLPKKFPEENLLELTYEEDLVLNSSIKYILKQYGTNELNQFLKQDLKLALDSNTYNTDWKFVKHLMGFKIGGKNDNERDNYYYYSNHYQFNNNDIISVKDFDLYFKIYHRVPKVGISEDDVKSNDPQLPKITSTLDDDMLLTISVDKNLIEISLNNFISSLPKSQYSNQLDEKEALIEYKDERYSIRITITMLTGEVEKGKFKIDNFRANVLLKEKGS